VFAVEFSNSRSVDHNFRVEKQLSGTVDEIAEIIVSKAMAHIFADYAFQGRVLSTAAQRYILAKTPEWVQQRPDIFDAIYDDGTFQVRLEAL
jgi:hypothetical protein